MWQLFSGSYDNSQFHKLIKDKIAVFHIVLGVSVCDGLQYLGLIRNKLPHSARVLRGTMSRVLVGASQNTEVYLLMSSGTRTWILPCHCSSVLPTFANASVCKEVRAFCTYFISDRSPRCALLVWSLISHPCNPQGLNCRKKRVSVVFPRGSVHTSAFVSRLVDLRLECASESPAEHVRIHRFPGHGSNLNVHHRGIDEVDVAHIHKIDYCYA